MGIPVQGVGGSRGEQFRPAERLKKRAEFKRTQRKGRRSTGPHLVVYARPNSLEWSRLGLTVSRKVGKATRRNRWKRRLREIFRRNKAEIPSGYDVVVIVKHSAPADPDFETLREEMIDLLNQAASPS